jgi:glycosyltransferase involved in cell wall biosynthesis
MPVYNQERFVTKSIDSVLAQEFEDMEIVIVDDASSDRTPEIVRDYERRFPGLFRVAFHESNRGVTKTCNHVLSLCEGKYVAFTAGDDLWLPGKIHKQVRVMEGEEGCILCYHDIEFFESETGRTLQHRNSGPLGIPPREGSARSVARALMRVNFIGGQSVMVRRDALPEEGYDTRVKFSSDWLMWIEVLARSEGNVCYLPEILARYRRHEANISKRREAEEDLTVFAIVVERYPWLRREVYFAGVRTRLRNGLRRAVGRHGWIRNLLRRAKSRVGRSDGCGDDPE